jgi:ATP-dependent Clp protease ATP-binding subunit ClpA
MKDNFYRVPCHSLNAILKIKKLKDKEQKAFFQKLVNYVTTNKSEVTMAKYFIFVLSGLLLEESSELFEKVLKEIKDEKAVSFALVSEIYNAVTDIYTPFRIEVILEHINDIKLNKPTDIIRNYEDEFKKMLDENVQRLEKKKKPEKQTLTVEGVENIRQYLKENIIGQDKAIDALIEHLMLLCAGLETRASFFFVGPTGVGKSQLAKLFGELYSGNFQIFNCAEYSHGHEMARLIGSPPGFIGHSEKSFLKDLADKSNKWVFLFDEIEKAHPKFYNFLLGLLDTGKVFDSNNQELDFSNSVFIFTSNKGQSDLKDVYLGFTKDKTDNVSFEAKKETVEKSLKTEFSAEFRNRIDEFIHFNELGKEDCMKIAELNLKNLPIKPTPQLLEYIVNNSFTKEYGARDLKRFVKKSVALKLSKIILNKSVPKDGSNKFDCEIKDNSIEITNYTVKKTKKAL